MPARSVKARISEASGALSRRRTVDSLTTSTSCTLTSSEDIDEIVLSWARIRLKRTASALNGVPSWNFTPRRSLSTRVFGSGVSHDSASPGFGFSFSSKRTRVSNTG